MFSQTENRLWPATPDLAAVEAVPLEQRGLPASTYEVLIRAAEQWPDREALLLLRDAASWQTPEIWTFATLRDRVHGIANVLTAFGVGRGDVVGLLAPNTGTTLAAVLAAQAVGVVQPINPTLGRETITALLRLGGARVLVAAGPELDAVNWELAVALAEELGLAAVLAVRPDVPDGERPLLGRSTVRTAYLEDLMPDSNRLMALDLPAPDDLAAYFHTGGTTGTPKLAAHTHANEVVVAWAMAAGAGWADGGTVLAGLPLFHVNALHTTVLAPLFGGQRTLWVGPLGYRDVNLYGAFWKIVERYRVASMSAVPTVYGVLSQLPVDADISSLDLAVVGAAPLPPIVRDQFEAHTGVALCDGYGLTEATCASARIVRDRPRRGSVGQRMPYQQIKAVSGSGPSRDLPPGESGLLMISGPAVFPGYVRRGDDGELTIDATGKVVDGWLDTGDLGLIDEDGYVYLTGRAKDLIIRGGHNIDPAVIENALRAHPDVTDAGAVGQPDAHAGEVPVAYVTLRAGASIEMSDLRAWAAAGVAEPAAVPKEIYVVDSIPVTAIGKPFKPALREDALRRALRAELTQRGLEKAVGTVEVDRVADGTPIVRVDRPGDDGAADAVAAAFGRFAVNWSFRGDDR